MGEDHDFKSGVAVFCRKAFGAVASGIFFGLGLLIILYSFHKRFDREENVVEVSAVRSESAASFAALSTFQNFSRRRCSFSKTVAVAYVGYYVSEVVWGLSGVISTVGKWNAASTAHLFYSCSLGLAHMRDSSPLVYCFRLAVTGVMVRFLGRSMINDPKLLDDFWVLLEHMLNTVLFVLGGVVWVRYCNNGIAR